MITRIDKILLSVIAQVFPTKSITIPNQIIRIWALYSYFILLATKPTYIKV